MKTFLIAVDTSGFYSHETRKNDVLQTLGTLCNDVEVTLITFDARGIVHHEVSDFLNKDISPFMEPASYREVLDILDDYDAQQMFTGYVNIDVLMKELSEYSVETFGFDVEEA